MNPGNLPLVETVIFSEYLNFPIVEMERFDNIVARANGNAGIAIGIQHP